MDLPCDDAPPGYRTQSNDTPFAIEQLLIAAWRRMEPWEKAARLVQCCSALERLELAGLRRRHPDACEEELRLRSAARRLGRETVAAVYGWDPDAPSANGS